MTVCLPVELPAALAYQSGVLTLLDELQARVRCAENGAAGMERAQAGNRRIGMAVGILMYPCQLTEDQAIALLTTHTQQRNVTVRELAETVICTGRL